MRKRDLQDKARSSPKHNNPTALSNCRASNRGNLARGWSRAEFKVDTQPDKKNSVPEKLIHTRSRSTTKVPSPSGDDQRILKKKDDKQNRAQAEFKTIPSKQIKSEAAS